MSSSNELYLFTCPHQQGELILTVGGCARMYQEAQAPFSFFCPSGKEVANSKKGHRLPLTVCQSCETGKGHAQLLRLHRKH
ncbi:MAG: hypothetical protein HON68_07785 [Gammaproteobacteria bacterium]|jgi:hypothetical protein|nr:hypothetical protein [Gammaproteobacteria bacterium]MBT4606354.1 hypothetical protein [Thiotrichales bacterium]MBT4078988.1 hypothetical protein [Gammaproteobacteria bacterium]MBT4331375.1 hypothetical protein [Gammaproteobacteria bacterium]MBT4789019.1 hypothetical protein [Gammaproteobacteria bacterium]